MRKLVTSALLTGLLGVAAMPALATPATLGFYPATDIYPKGTTHLDVDVYGRGIKGDAAVTVGATMGAGSGSEGVLGRYEAGFDYFLSAGGATPVVSGSKRLLFNAKAQLMDDADKGVRLVGGVWGVGSKTIAAPNYLYIAGSKVTSSGRFTLGVAHSLAGKVGGVRVIAAPSGNDDRTSLHLGYDKALSSKLSFAADWYSGKNAWAAVQPTLYYAVTPTTSLGVGVVRFNDSSVAPSRNQMYWALDINFD